MALYKNCWLMGCLLLTGGWSSIAISADNGTARKVTTQLLSEVVIYPRSTAPALALSLNESRISAEIGARVTAIPVRVGDRVKQGDPLVTLGCDELRLHQGQAAAALLGVEARQEFAAAQVQRSERLRSGDVLSEELMQQRRSDLKSAEAERAVAAANLRVAELNVARCTISAPFAGVVLARLVSEGEWVAPGTPVVALLDNQRLELSAQVGMDEAKGLRQAKQLIFVAQGESYPVTLRALPEKIDPTLRQREARLSFVDRTPLTGQVGRLEWQSGIAHLPADLPVQRAGRLGLFIVTQDKAVFVALPDAIEGRPAPLVALPEGSVVVIEGRQSLRDGDSVKVVR